MRKFLLYLLFFVILIAFFTDIYFFFFLFNRNLEDANRLREASLALKNISTSSTKIYSGLDVSNSIVEIKENKDKFESFLMRRNLAGINFETFSSLWRETNGNIATLVKNERSSGDFFRAYSDINSSISPMVERLEIIEKQCRKKAKFYIFVFGIINILIIISLSLFLVLLQRKRFSDFEKKRLAVKNLLENLNKEVEEVADEIEEISTKTIKLSLRKSENGYSLITSSLEEMRKRIDSFLDESFVTEGEDSKGNLQKLIDSLSLSLNNIIANTIVEMEKFKETEKSIEKISGKLSFLKKKVAEISLSIRNKEKEL